MVLLSEPGMMIRTFRRSPVLTSSTMMVSGSISFTVPAPAETVVWLAMTVKAPVCKWAFSPTFFIFARCMLVKLVFTRYATLLASTAGLRAPQVNSHFNQPLVIIRKDNELFLAGISRSYHHVEQATHSKVLFVGALFGPFQVQLLGDENRV